MEKLHTCRKGYTKETSTLPLHLYALAFLQELHAQPISMKYRVENFISLFPFLNIIERDRFMCGQLHASANSRVLLQMWKLKRSMDNIECPDLSQGRLYLQKTRKIYSNTFLLYDIFQRLKYLFSNWYRQLHL